MISIIPVGWKEGILQMYPDKLSMLILGGRWPSLDG